jgi:hypothetical protein
VLKRIGDVPRCAAAISTTVREKKKNLFSTRPLWFPLPNGVSIKKRGGNQEEEEEKSFREDDGFGCH